MVLDTGKSSFDTGERSRILVNPVLILVKTSGILVKVVWDTGKSSFDTVKWSRILVNPVFILVKTTGILVKVLGYW